MKNLVFKALLLPIVFASCAPHIGGTSDAAFTLDKVVTLQEVERIETTLASDAMEGRKAFTPAIEKSADFIAEEFRKIGLKPLDGLKDYRQTFEMIRSKFVSLNGTLNSSTLDSKNAIVFSASPSLTITEKSGFKIVNLKAGLNLSSEVTKYLRGTQNVLITADTSYTKAFANLSTLKRTLYSPIPNVAVVLSAEEPKSFSITAEQQVTKVTGANIVGVLPGKSKQAEQVIFSGHYDHLGIGKPEGTDSIYNGANDDAAGTTAVIMAAKYYKAAANNERTLVFVAFTAEEAGLLGSQYFSRNMNPDNVMAMFNIEMIGTESKWGKSSVYVTGYPMSNLAELMQKNIKDSAFVFHPDPYTNMRLFYRSDNATLARLGVPAHTFSTSKMDSEPYYHKAGDEVKTLDLQNMTSVIKSIILGASGIVNGTQTPTRVALPTVN